MTTAPAAGLALPALRPDSFNDVCPCCGHQADGGIVVWYALGEDHVSGNRHFVLPRSVFPPGFRPDVTLEETKAIQRFLDPLRGRVADRPSAAHFSPGYLRPLEAAGYKVRPFVGLDVPLPPLQQPHAIVYRGQPVGMVMPLTGPRTASADVLVRLTSRTAS